jgi:hypothetical protein
VPDNAETGSATSAWRAAAAVLSKASTCRASTASREGGDAGKADWLKALIFMMHPF